MSIYTERLYYEDAYKTAFEAEVIDRRCVKERPAVILNQTCFYPTSGGQPHDCGILNGVRVRDVIEEDQGIVHVLEATVEENRVRGEINWPRRYDHMQQHTGQHILSESFIAVLDARTVSFHMSADLSTIDITREPGTPEEWNAVERRVNDVIGRNLPVRTYWVEPEQVAALNLRHIPEREGRFRIVDIEGSDRAACGGTHCASTGEVGVIQLLNRRPKRVHGNLYRVEFLCGCRALKDYARKISLVNALTGTLGVGEAELYETVTRLIDERKQTERALEEARDRLIDVEASGLGEAVEDINGLRIIAGVFPDRNQEELKKLAQRLVRQKTCVVLFGGGTVKPQLVFARSEELKAHMGMLMRGATDLIGGRGGGRSEMAMGGGPDMQAIEQAIDWAKAYLTQKPS